MFVTPSFDEFKKAAFNRMLKRIGIKLVGDKWIDERKGKVKMFKDGDEFETAAGRFVIRDGVPVKQEPKRGPLGGELKTISQCQPGELVYIKAVVCDGYCLDFGSHIGSRTIVETNVPPRLSGERMPEKAIKSNRISKTNSLKDEILNLHKAGQKYWEIAAKVGFPQNTVYKALQRWEKENAF